MNLGNTIVALTAAGFLAVTFIAGSAPASAHHHEHEQLGAKKLYECTFHECGAQRMADSKPASWEGGKCLDRNGKPRPGGHSWSEKR